MFCFSGSAHVLGRGKKMGVVNESVRLFWELESFFFFFWTYWVYF
jgi:hypothetical protein